MQPSPNILFILHAIGKDIVEMNRRFLTSIVKCLEFCGRQGLALRGHKDDATVAEKRDQVLQEHLEICSKKALYISKTTQNKLLECIRQYVQNQIIDEIRAQSIGLKFSVQADKLLI